MTIRAVAPEEHRDAMEDLIAFMRARGLVSYRGPLLGKDWKVDVEVDLGAAPLLPLPPPAEPPPKAPGKRGADGYTAEEQLLAYGRKLDAED